MKVKHLSGLDGLRFISISFVVLHHLLTFKAYFGFDDFNYPVFGLIGLYGIHFFFMGSGFLITYLLLHEKTQRGAISLRRFYLRRVLRIWPAYYLLIAVALLIILKQPFFRIPEITDAYLASNYKKGNAFFFFFLPHLAAFNAPTAPYVHHTYTIGIEEQFYVLWGLLFYFFYRHVYWVFIFLLISIPILNICHQQLYDYTVKVASPSHFLIYVQQTMTYLNYSRFSTFAIGALFGYAYFFKKNWIFYFKRRNIQIAVYTLFALSIITGLEIPYIQNEYMAANMGCIMLTASFGKESIFNFSKGWLEYLGKISYGIYLFHLFAIVFAIKILNGIFNLPLNTLSQFILLCMVTLGLAILFGWVSYHYFEYYFLKLKRKFRSIETRHE